jgi:spermidine synthase
VGALRGGAALRAQLAVALTLALVVGVRPPWSPLRMTAGLYNYASTFDAESRNREDILTFVEGRYDLVHYAEGLSSVVTVARHKKSGNLWLANNGKVDASTTLDMPTQVLVGLLPFPWAREVDDVLVIGLASGITAGAVAQVDAIERLTVVELEPTMPAAARWFDAYNHAVLDDPRLDLVANDGRNHLLLTPEASYDVVVAEPSNPWLTGVSNLFTEEFFALGKRRLKPGGVWAQWVQIYGMGDRDLRSLLATFAHVYPHVQLFAPLENADLVLVGSDAPLPLRAERVAQARARWPRVAAELDGLGLPHPESLLASWVTDRDGVLRVAGEIELNTDDNMRIEYGAPLHLHRRTASRNLELLARAWSVPVDAVDRDPLALLRLAEAYLTGADLDRALLASAHAVDAVRGEGALADQIHPWLTSDAGDARALATLTLAGDALAEQLGPDAPWSAAWAAWKTRLEVWIRG